jgi:oxygen-independent coproporphyrinogen-3 oxidase
MYNKNDLGLYIHVPFCKSKCFYCDFNSFAGKEEFIPSYFKALKAELEYYKNKLIGFRIKTIFIGGGTPTLVEPQYLNEILVCCKQNLNVEEDAEITIESNPGTLSFDKLMSYKTMGINRISIGLQAWQKKLLSKLGRIHSLEEFLENYNLARKVGFKNINIDLIFGLPGQTLKDWEETLEKVLQLQPEHVSCYSLKIEEGTAFGKWVETGELEVVEDELDREMYYLAKEMFKNFHLTHYEISNFAKSGFECKHNLVYWKQDEYIGIGAGAHSFFMSRRYNNIYDIEKYISIDFSKEPPVEGVNIIEKQEAMSEFLILGLSLLDGISGSEFYNRFKVDLFDIYNEKINLLKNKNLIEIFGDKIKLTKLGLDLANQVFVEFV